MFSELANDALTNHFPSVFDEDQGDTAHEAGVQELRDGDRKELNLVAIGSTSLAKMHALPLPLPSSRPATQSPGSLVPTIFG